MNSGNKMNSDKHRDDVRMRGLPGNDASDNDVVFVTKWTCDVCRVAAFDSYEEAVAHEMKCGKTPSTKPSNVPSNDISPKKNNAIIPKNPNQTAPVVGQDASDPSGNLSDSDSVICLTVWTCDKCRVAEFSTYTEAVEHEKICTHSPTKQNQAGPPKTKVTESHPKKSQSLPEETHAKVSKDSDIETNAQTVSKSQQVPSSITNNQIPASSNICLEKKNIEKTEVDISPDRSLVSSPQNSEKSKTNDKVLINLTPLIDSVEDCEHYYSISTYDLMISKSIDFFEDKCFYSKNNFPKYTISCRCHFCKVILAEECTLDKLISDWQGKIFSHFLSCISMPIRIKEMLMTVKPYASTGKVDVSTFLNSFFNENGIQEMNAARYEGIPDEKCYSCFLPIPTWTRRINESTHDKLRTVRRARWMLENNLRPPKIVLNKVMSIVSKGNITPPKPTIPKPAMIVYNPSIEYDNIPIFFPNSHKYAAMLSPANLFALQQLKLCCSKGGNNVSLACIHCNSQSLLSDKESWHKRAYSMIYAHLLKSCSSTPSSIRDKLIHFQNVKKKKQYSTPSLGLRQFCEYVTEYYGFGSMPSKYGVVMRDPNNLTKDVTKPAKRKLIEAKHDVTLGSPDENLNKKQRSSSQEVKKAAISWDLFVFENGSKGVHTYLPPQGGVPLISSVSTVSASKLNKHLYLLLDQLEFFEIEKVGKNTNITNSVNPIVNSSALGIRCQNCKSQPNISFSLKLSRTEDLSKTVYEFISHLEVCPYTPDVIRKELSKNKATTKSTVLLDTYCKSISTSYSLEDFDTKDSQEHGKGVIWGENIPYDFETNRKGQTLEKGQSFVIDQIKETNKKSFVKSVNGDHQAVSSSLATTRDWSERMVLSDYNYIILGQIDLAAVPKKVPTSQTSTRTSLRQRNKFGDPDKESTSKSSSRSGLPVLIGESFTLGLRCKHCLHSRGLSSIQQCVTNHTYNFFNHFKKCPKIPRKIAAKLDEVKAYQSLQKASDGVVAMTEYIRKIILDVYKMEDLEWNGVSGGVILGSDAENIIKKYSRKKKEDSSNHEHDFALPYILEDFAEPVTSYLTDFVT